MNNTCIRMYRGTINDGYYYFVLKRDNKLIRINLETGVISIKDNLCYRENEEKFVVNDSYRRLIIIPANGYEALYYDIENSKQIIKAINYNRTSADGYGFSGYALFYNSLFMFPCFADRVLKLDVENYNVQEVVPNLLEDIRKITGTGRGPIFCVGIKQIREKVYLPGISTNFIAELDLKSLNYNIFQLENETNVNGYRTVNPSEDLLYMVNQAQSVMVYEKESKKLVGRAKREGIESFSYCLPFENGLIWIPQRQEDSFFIKEDFEGGITIIPYPDDYVSMLDYIPREQGGLFAESDDEYIFCPHLGNMIVRINKNTGAIRFVELHYSESILEYYCSQDKNIINESKDLTNNYDVNGLYGICSLDSFIDSFRYK